MNRKLLKLCLIGCLSVLIFLILVLSVVFTYRKVSVEYVFNIKPKEGETLKEVTVYLPFPSYRGKPMRKIFDDVKKDYEVIEKFSPGVKWELIDTKHGPMLKVYIPELNESFGVDSWTTLSGIFLKTPPQDKFLLSPRENVISTHKSSFGDYRNFYTYIYSDYREGSGFILRIDYHILHKLSLLPSQAGSGSGGSCVGTRELPKEWRYEIEINEKGWIKLPVIEVH